MSVSDVQIKEEPKEVHEASEATEEPAKDPSIKNEPKSAEDKVKSEEAQQPETKDDEKAKKDNGETDGEKPHQLPKPFYEMPLHERNRDCPGFFAARPRPDFPGFFAGRSGSVSSTTTPSVASFFDSFGGGSFSGINKGKTRPQRQAKGQQTVPMVPLQPPPRQKQQSRQYQQEQTEEMAPKRRQNRSRRGKGKDGADAINIPIRMV